MLEVKCPHCVKDGLPKEEVNMFCLTKDNDKWKLKRTHTYYYQVQMQLAVCKLPYCDFIVWSRGEVIVERITVDYAFYNSKMEDVRHFFIYGVLPEIVGKWYTRKPVASTAGRVPLPTSTATPTSDMQSAVMDEKEDFSKLWCYCNEPSHGDMILCDHEMCTIKWFHFDCLRILSTPKGKWYCPSCRKLPKFSARKRK